MSSLSVSWAGCLCAGNDLTYHWRNVWMKKKSIWKNFKYGIWFDYTMQEIWHFVNLCRSTWRKCWVRFWTFPSNFSINVSVNMVEIFRYMSCLEGFESLGLFHENLSYGKMTYRGSGIVAFLLLSLSRREHFIQKRLL